METNLKGRTVLITGGAMGIGRATALAFAREGSRFGARGHRQAGARKPVRGDQGAGIRGDLWNWRPEQRARRHRRITAALQGELDSVDVLVNNVGSGFVRTFDQLADEDWEKTLQLNFMSYVRAIRLVLPGMRERRSGVIVNNASDLARQPEPVPNDYSVSKAAVLALTKGLARSEGPNIRVNAVAPGPIWTPFWSKPGGFADTMAAFHKMPPKEAVEFELSLRQMPLRRRERPRKSRT